MKKILFLVVSAFFCLTSYAGEIVLEGNYQGKNLYVKNPFTSSGVGFCTFEVRVNDEITTDEWNSSAFEIDFMSQQLNIGDKVVVKIKHKEDCTPVVLNPEVLQPRSTFTIVSINAERDGSVTWTTTGESGKLPYIVEQYRWNKWVKVGEVEGNGTPSENTYSLKVMPHSGLNKIRVKQIDFSGSPRYSQAVSFRSVSPEIQFTPLRVETDIQFMDMEGNETETMYEIYDDKASLVRKGYGSKVNLKSLKQGTYYINWDVKTGTFIKK